MDTTIREAIVPFFRQVRVVPLQPVRGEMGESELFGPQGFQDNHDLHSHPQQGVAGSPESGGCALRFWEMSLATATLPGTEAFDR